MNAEHVELQGFESHRHYSRDAVVRFVEDIVQWHPDGATWADLPAIIRRHPRKVFYLAPTTRVVDLAHRIAQRDAQA